MSANNFRLASKNLFLTFPQCEFSLEEFKQKVLEFFADLEIIKGVCSREQHEDGNHHLHLYVNLKKECRTRNAAYFDNLVSPPKHPNIVSRVKNQLKTIEYVIKDGEYQVLPSEDLFDLQLFLSQAKKKKSTACCLKIVTMIKEGATLDELDEEEPSYMMQHLSQVQRYLDFQELKKLRQLRAEALQEVFHVCPAAGHETSWNTDLASWLNRNIRTPTKRPHRTPQLWLRSSPATGKTTLIEYLRTTFQLAIYYLPLNENWYDGYADGCFDLIVLDEYKAHKKITDLNPILSGDPVPLSRRSTSPILKRDNLPVIILSNFLSQECYHKATPMQLAPLLSRLEIIDFGDNLVRIVKDIEDVSETPSLVEETQSFSDPELDSILSELPEPEPEPYPVFLPPIPVPQTPPVSEPQYLTLEEELDPNSDFFFSNQYRREISKRMRGDIEPVQTIRLSRAMRSIQPKRQKTPRNNSFINQFFDSEAQFDSESDESESYDDSPHSSDEDFLDDSHLVETNTFQRSRRVRFFLDSQED